jgi:Tat protein secretion system quality control protein TatD with DNase activity
MIETDAPYLIPRNMGFVQGRMTNEPKYLSFVAKKIAEEYGISTREVIEESTKNAMTVLRIE